MALYTTNYGIQVDINLPPPELWVTNFGYQVDINLDIQEEIFAPNFSFKFGLGF